MVGPPTFRAAVGYEITVSLARELDASLGNLCSTEAVADFLALLATGFSGHVEGALYLCTHICTILPAITTFDIYTCSSSLVERGLHLLSNR